VKDGGYIVDFHLANADIRPFFLMVRVFRGAHKKN
jgi:hypothetical protein